jgi:hypothetical protein
VVFAKSSVGKLPQFAFTEGGVRTVNGLKQFGLQFWAVFFRVEHAVRFQGYAPAAVSEHDHLPAVRLGNKKGELILCLTNRERFLGLSLNSAERADKSACLNAAAPNYPLCTAGGGRGRYGGQEPERRTSKGVGPGRDCRTTGE